MEKIFKISKVGNCTTSQLSEIGIDEIIIDTEVKVYDINKYDGFNGPCSRIITAANGDYILPTKWLIF